tara:strand:- start:293 stop:769 length:477 start_codon:yes stop_codon:yes gene_type:complete
MNFEELNARDIYELFSSLYKEKHNAEYQGSGWIGNEMHSLRNLLDEYGPAQVACSTLNCIINNDKTVTIPYFAAGIKYYITSYNPVIYYAITRWGTPKIKKLWRHFLVLDAVWFPSATQRSQRKLILKELKEWANAKTNKETTKRVNKKTNKQKKNDN